MTPKYWTLPILAVLLLAVSSVFSENDQKVGQRSDYKVVPLDPPALITTKPLVDGPLLRGETMKFSLNIDRAPRPINMWSGRIDYTTTTLTFLSAESLGQDTGTVLVVSDPYNMFPGWESRSVSGISLNGWSNGEVAELTFEVKEDAPETGSLGFGDHPFVKEKLAHDDPDAFVIYEYQRAIDCSKTMDLAVEDVSAEHQPYKFATPAPKVLYQKSN